MTISRRLFMSFLLTPTIQTEEVRASVLEVFEIDGRAKAALVNQISPDERDSFAAWLRTHAESRVRVHTIRGEESSATMFRVRMCFGRGLILFDRTIRIHEREVLTVIQIQ